MDSVATTLRQTASRALHALPDSTQHQVRGLASRGLNAMPASAQQKLRALRASTAPAGAPPPDPVRSVPLETLDDELAEAARLFTVSEDAARAFLDGFRVAPPGDAPSDPFSPGYLEWTWALYRGVSGRPSYSTDNEASPFDLDHALARPYPFQTESATTVAHDLEARARVIDAIGRQATSGLVPPCRLVEFGPGWGNLTNDLAATGFKVTAVEVDHQFCSLIQQRCAVPDNLDVVQSGMLDFSPDGLYDAAIFFESFHHCSDHLAMLANLHSVVKPDGWVFFASEPVTPLTYPWGPRLDGLSVWSSRTYGWLELGFEEAYFHQALERTGWSAGRLTKGPGQSPMDVFVARAVPGWSAPG
jgi:SAM-dependent methyltransferase